MIYKILSDFPNYKIYENGQILNKSNKLLTIAKDYRIELSHKGNRKIFRVPRLIYELFTIDTLNDLDDIKFKDETIKEKLHYTNLIKLDRVNPRKNLNYIELNKNKEWKPIKNHENYLISNYGDVYSIKMNILLKYIISDGYKNYTLMFNNKGTRYRGHILVYDTYIGLSGNKELVIDHIDRDKLNNYIENLRETTRSINTINVDKVKYIGDPIEQYTLKNEYIKTWSCIKEILNTHSDYKKCHIKKCYNPHNYVYKGFIWKNPKYIDTSSFTTVKTNDGLTYSNYKINIKGQVVNNYNRILNCYSCNKYNMIKLRADNKKFKAYSLHQLTAMTFIENNDAYPVVNHINKNRSDNNINNLEWCTYKHNGKHSLGKKVHKIDPKTNEIIETYNSISDIYDSMNKKYSNGIYRACTGKYQTSYGYKWAYA